MADKPLKEQIAGALYNIFRRCFMTTLTLKQLDTLNEEAADLAAVFEKAAERKALEVVKRLNDGVKTAFDLMTTDMEALELKVVQMLDVLKEIEKAIKSEPEKVEIPAGVGVITFNGHDITNLIRGDMPVVEVFKAVEVLASRPMSEKEKMFMIRTVERERGGTDAPLGQYKREDFD